MIQVHGAACRSHRGMMRPEGLKLVMRSSAESEMKTCYNVWQSGYGEEGDKMSVGSRAGFNSAEKRLGGPNSHVSR